MKIIAISGWKGSGKDTVAGHLIAEFGAQRTSFAGPLKDMAAAEYGFPREHADDPAFKEMPLLNLPVYPEDKFTKMVTDFMMLEFRDQNGKKMGEGSPESIMYWTPRALCILKGSMNRAVDSAFWVKQTIKTINEKTEEGHGLHVITDLRYKSELGQLKAAFDQDVVFVRVKRFETSPSVDPSERDLDDATFDFYVDNTGTLASAYDQIEQILNRI